MPPAKKVSGKPKLSADLKATLGERMGQVVVKVGFVNALSIQLTNEQLQAILDGVTAMGEFEKYYDIPDQEWGTDLVACVVYTFPEDDEAFLPDKSEKMKAAMEKQGMEQDLIQWYFWKVKCEAPESNALLVWMSEEQFAQLDFDKTYIFIGILQKQVSGPSGEVDKAGKKIYREYNSMADVPEGATAWVNHSLKLVEFLG